MREQISLHGVPRAADLTPLAVDVVASWLACAPREVETLHGYLSADERARADRFLVRQARDRFAVGRGRLRELLGGLCDCPPGDVRFALAGRGKPRLVPGESRGPGTEVGARLRFNVAHSGDLMLCAVTLDHEVGVDVESVRPEFEWEHLARRYFAEGEVRALKDLPPTPGREAFFACWTRKEAVIKATGEGMARALASFTVTVDPAHAAMLDADSSLGRPEEWSLLPVALPPGYRGTVAVRAPVVLRLAWLPGTPRTPRIQAHPG